MARTYQEDVTTTILQPQSVRLRHRFRGPRESWKLNLETDQWMADMVSLYSTAATTAEYLEDLEGNNLGVQTETPETSEVEEFYRDGALVGYECYPINSLMLMIESLNQRVRGLEGR